MRSRVAQFLGTLTLVAMAVGCSSAKPGRSDFQWNTGQYLSPPDVIASRTGGDPVTMPCGKRLIIYAYHGRWVADCGTFQLMAVQNDNVAEAAHVARRYANTKVTCERGCEKSLRYVWAGWDCRHAPDEGPPGLPYSDSAAVELAVSCAARTQPDLGDLQFEAEPPELLPDDSLPPESAPPELDTYEFDTPGLRPPEPTPPAPNPLERVPPHFGEPDPAPKPSRPPPTPDGS